jgi:hypothetical protein
MLAAPAAPYAKNKKHTSVVAAGFAGTTGLPCAMVLTVSSGLSLVTGLFCHHRRLQCASIAADLNASVGASGPHGFAVRHRVIRPRDD